MSEKPPVSTWKVLAAAAVALAAALSYNYLTYDPEAMRRARPDTRETRPAGERSREELVAAGREPYVQFCSACHRADGKGIPGTYPRLDGSLVVLGPAERHIEIVLNGRPNTVMPSFRDQLSDHDIAAIVTYERNAWVFKAFDAVTPAEVAALRASTAPSVPGR